MDNDYGEEVGVEWETDVGGVVRTTVKYIKVPLVSRALIGDPCKEPPKDCGVHTISEGKTVCAGCRAPLVNGGGLPCHRRWEAGA